jgi:hypothetical protein
MSVSALFKIDPGTGTYGAAGVAADATPSVTVNCKLDSIVGMDRVEWTIFGSHDGSIPVITLSGSPPGQIASFPVPAGNGQAYGIRCDVNGGIDVGGDTRTSAVYVANVNGDRPFFIGETFESNATAGVVPRVNEMQLGRALVVLGQERVEKTSYQSVTTSLGGVSDAIPQLSQGDIVMTSPTLVTVSAVSRIEVDALVNFSATGGSQVPVVGHAHINDASNAMAVGWGTSNTAGNPTQLRVWGSMASPGAAQNIVVKLVLSLTTGATNCYVNGYDSGGGPGRVFGGAMISSLVVREVTS